MLVAGAVFLAPGRAYFPSAFLNIVLNAVTDLFVPRPVGPRA